MAFPSVSIHFASPPSLGIVIAVCVPSVTVSSACTATPMTCPVSASNPDGKSTLMTAAPASRAALMRRTAERSNPSRGRARPVPNRASTTTPPGGTAQSRSTTGISSASIRFRLLAASSGSLPSSPINTANTSIPSRCRWRATTKPSPPLFPAPQMIPTWADARSPRASITSTRSATARPAVSIKTSPGTPSVEMLCRSSARISAALTRDHPRLAFMGPLFPSRFVARETADVDPFGSSLRVMLSG